MIGGTAHLDDVVLAVLSHLRKKSDTFTANREDLHRAFAQMKQVYPAPFAQLTFRAKGFFPESLGLDQALANLEACGLLHRMNEAPLLYQIDPEIDESYQRFTRKRLTARGLTDAQMDEVAAGLLETLQASLAT